MPLPIIAGWVLIVLLLIGALYTFPKLKTIGQMIGYIIVQSFQIATILFLMKGYTGG